MNTGQHTGLTITTVVIAKACVAGAALAKLVEPSPTMLLSGYLAMGAVGQPSQRSRGWCDDRARTIVASHNNGSTADYALADELRSGGGQLVQ